MANQPETTASLTLELRQQPQAYRTLKRVVQFIHAQGLEQGDRLPVHQELARMLNVSNDTLTTVMRELSRLGVLQRRTRAGTVVANLDAVPPLVWTVGLATVPATTSGPTSFFAELAVRIQQEVARHNWRCSTYYHFQRGFPSELSWFGPLVEDLRDNSIDALVTLAVIKKDQWQIIHDEGVIGMHCGIDERAANSVLMDEGVVAEEGLRLLADRGCKSVCAVTPSASESDNSRFGAALRKTGRELSITLINPVDTSRLTSLEGGLELADQLLSLPAGKRPDGLIVLDDFIALGLTNRLANTGDYRPHVVVKAHKQLPLAYALPVIRFEVDINALADAAVEKLHGLLMNPASEPTREWIAPHLIARQPQHTPQADQNTSAASANV